MLLVRGVAGALCVVKDYAPRTAPIRWLAPRLVSHELAMLERLEGLPGVPRALGRIGRLALAMEFVEGTALRKRLHQRSLPASFFDALEGILAGLAARGVIHLDLRSPSNVLITPTGAPVLVDLASAVILPVPESWICRVQQRGLAKLRRRFAADAGEEPAPLAAPDDAQLVIRSVRLRYRERGPLEDPVPALLLHDAGASSAIFGNLLDGASEAGRRAIAVDVPGFGYSSRGWPGRSPRAAARWIGRFLDALRLSRVDVVGHLYGGLVARELAAALPDRVRALATLDAPLAALRGRFRARFEAAREGAAAFTRLREPLAPGLGPEALRELEWLRGFSAPAAARAYRRLRVRRGAERAERAGAGAPPALDLAGIAIPAQPWLHVTSCGQGLEAAEVAGAPRVQAASWTEPLVDPVRFWKALQSLAAPRSPSE